MPVAILALSAFALFNWPSAYPYADGLPLEMKVFAQRGDEASSADAIADRLEDERGRVTVYASRMLPHPVWLSVGIPSTDAPRPVLELPDRHGIEVECWDADSNKHLGRADLLGSSGDVSRYKTGFVLEGIHSAQTVLCSVRSMGPAKIRAVLWNDKDLRTSAAEFERHAGMLSGALLMLAVFAGVTGLMNRKAFYLVFALWLIGNLRVTELSIGTDFSWLGRALPYDYLDRIRSITRAFSSVAIVALFSLLFRKESQLPRYRPWLTFTALITLIQPINAILLPRSTFIAVNWGLGAAAAITAMWLLGDIAWRTRSRIAYLYGTGLIFFLASIVGAILDAAFGIEAPFTIFNQFNGAFGSALFTSLAISERIRLQDAERNALQKQQKFTFEFTPIGLFTLDLQGRFVSANPEVNRMLGADVTSPGKMSFHKYFLDGAWTNLLKTVREHQTAELVLLGGEGLSGKLFQVKATEVRGSIEGTMQDITTVRKAFDDLEYLAQNDPVTGVLNHRGALQAFNLMGLQEPPPQTKTVAYISLERFSAVKDIYGTPAADEVIGLVADRLRRRMPAGASLARLGTDEFACFFQNVTGEWATHFAYHVIADVEGSPYPVNGRMVRLSACVGVAEVDNQVSFEQAVTIANKAVRECRADTMQRVVLYERQSKAHLEHMDELEIVAMLDGASQRPQLQLRFRPLLRPAQPRSPLDLEVVVVLVGKDKQITPHSRLQQLAESTLRTASLDRWALEDVLGWLERSSARALPSGFIALPVHATSLADEDFRTHVLPKLRAHRDLARKLCLIIRGDIDHAGAWSVRSVVNELRGAGVMIALDEVEETGLGDLLATRVDFVRVSDTMLQEAISNPERLLALKGLSLMTRSVGIRLMVDHVHDCGHVDLLAELSVDYIAGPLLGDYVDGSAIEQMSCAADAIKDEKCVDQLAVQAPPRWADMCAR